MRFLEDMFEGQGGREGWEGWWVLGRWIWGRLVLEVKM